ncbi:MAG: CinA family protein [Caldilineales bacterium]|nr:CinA family protein [Caldilineales bacterium]
MDAASHPLPAPSAEHIPTSGGSLSLAELAGRAGALLRGRRLTLALAESCTGGLVSDSITDVPGSSDYFLGGVVAYSNAAKQRLLGVREETLAAHGAVSAACAAEMAQGARRAFGAHVAVSITGIAGPGGGTPAKPVGLAFLHLSAADAEIGRQVLGTGDRRANKLESAGEALRLLIAYLERRSALP